MMWKGNKRELLELVRVLVLSDRIMYMGKEISEDKLLNIFSTIFNEDLKNIRQTLYASPNFKFITHLNQLAKEKL